MYHSPTTCARQAGVGRRGRLGAATNPLMAKVTAQWMSGEEGSGAVPYHVIWAGKWGKMSRIRHRLHQLIQASEGRGITLCGLPAELGPLDETVSGLGVGGRRAEKKEFCV